MLRTQPPRSALSEPWFDACNNGRLLIQHCRSCASYQFYPRIVCRACGAGDPQWVEACGRGLIASFSIVRHAISEAYSAPYVVALVDLQEGPRLMTNIVNCDLEQISIGMRVSLQFESWGDGLSMPVFTADASPGGL